MLFFKRIFKFEKAEVAQMEAAKDNRLNTRYTPGSSFPLHAYLSLVRYEWKPSKVLNISGTGINLLTAREARWTAGQDLKLKLVLGKYELILEGRLAHAALKEKGLHCGIALKFADFPDQQAYLQLLQPIVIGRSLAPVSSEQIVQDNPQLIKQVYRGEGNSELTVWLEKTMGTPLHRFEFQAHEYFCRADVNSKDLEVGVRAPAAAVNDHPEPGSAAVRGEVQRLFRWIPPNLSSAVPDDVRAFMQRFVI